MRDNDELLGFFNRDDADAEKYKAIDNFLKLSERFSRANVKRVRRLGFIIGTLLMAFGAGLWIISGEYNFVFAMFIIIGFIVIGCSLSYGKKGHVYPVESAELMIAADGIDAVYEDMLAGHYISNSSLLLGRTYLFGEGSMMVRLCDIKKIYMHSTSGRGKHSHYAAADIVSEAGSAMMLLEKLNKYGAGRYDRLAYLEEQIMAAKLLAWRD